MGFLSIVTECHGLSMTCPACSTLGWKSAQHNNFECQEVAAVAAADSGVFVMSDTDEINRVLGELGRVDQQIKDLDATEYNAVHHLSLTLDLPRKFAAVRDAESNLHELRRMASRLAQSYAENAVAIYEGSEISVSLEATDRRLAVCYFVVAVGKVFDAIAQFWGGPYAKLITDLKTPLTDIGKELTGLKPGPKGGPPDVGPLLPAQIVNTPMLAGNAIPGMEKLPGYGNLVALQKGLNSCIELVKDVAGLYRSYQSRDAIMTSTRELLVKLLDTAKTTLDAVNRSITFYQSQETLRKGTAPSKSVNKFKDYVSAAKYLVEAIMNFAQFGLSICDESADRRAISDAFALADRQMASTGGGTFDNSTQLFAHATKQDLINIIHSANSFTDARDMSHLAREKIRQLGSEIEQLKASRERHDRFWKRYRQECEAKKLKLRETQGRLPELRKTLANISSTAEFRWDGAWRTKDDLGRRIDELHARIEAILKPAPNRIPPNRRFGPHISPI